MGEEIFPVVRGVAGIGQEKSMRGGGEDPILRPRPAPLPSLLAILHLPRKCIDLGDILLILLLTRYRRLVIQSADRKSVV